MVEEAEGTPVIVDTVVDAHEVVHHRIDGSGDADGQRERRNGERRVCGRGSETTKCEASVANQPGQTSAIACKGSRLPCVSSGGHYIPAPWSRRPPHIRERSSRTADGYFAARSSGH
jgi:hypothetical protein